MMGQPSSFNSGYNTPMFVRVLRDGNPDLAITVKEVKDALMLFSQEHNLLFRGVDVILTDSERQIEHNTSLLNHRYDTDVITHESDTPMGKHVELFINGSTQFLETNESHQAYITRMLFHGLLHVAGYTDQNDSDKQTMHLEENRLLKLFHVEHKL